MLLFYNILVTTENIVVIYRNIILLPSHFFSVLLVHNSLNFCLRLNFYFLFMAHKSSAYFTLITLSQKTFQHACRTCFKSINYDKIREYILRNKEII